MIKIMISSTVQPSSSSAGVCTWRNSSHLHSLYLPLPLRLSASCSNLHPHIVDGFLENFPDQVVSPMAGGLLLGLWIHLWRGVATIYAGDPSSSSLSSSYDQCWHWSSLCFWCSNDDVQQRTWLQLIFNIVNLLRNWSQSYPTRFKTAPQALGGSVRWGEISKWTFIIRTRQSGAAAKSVCIDWKQQQRWRQEDVDRWEQQEMGKAKHPLQVLIFSKLPLAKTVGTSKKDDKYIIKNRETLWCKLWHHFPYEKSCMAFYVGKVP